MNDTHSIGVGLIYQVNECGGIAFSFNHRSRLCLTYRPPFRWSLVYDAGDEDGLDRTTFSIHITPVYKANSRTVVHYKVLFFYLHQNPLMGCLRLHNVFLWVKWIFRLKISEFPMIMCSLLREHAWSTNQTQ